MESKVGKTLEYDRAVGTGGAGDGVNSLLKMLATIKVKAYTLKNLVHTYYYLPPQIYRLSKGLALVAWGKSPDQFKAVLSVFAV